MATVLALALLSVLSPPETPGFPLSLGSCALEGAKLGELRSVYWELYQHTEVCVSFGPEPASAGLALTFSFTHVGRVMKERPQLVVLRAQLPPLAMVFSASVSLLVDGKEELDLTTGREYRMTYPPQCTPPSEGGCSFTGVEIAVPSSVFKRIAAAKTIEGRAFGIPFTLTP